jgi:hypothetical protein
MFPSRSKRRRNRLAARPISLETKWGWGPCIDQGWCAIPSALLRFAAPLGLSAEEGWLLVQLLDLKWSGEDATASLLAERCHLSPEETQAILQDLKERKFLRFNAKARPSRSDARSGAPRALIGWEIDLSPLLRMLDDYIMRGGDLSAGFLHLTQSSSDRSDNASESGG